MAGPLDWLLQRLGGTQGQGPMMRQDREGTWSVYQPQPYKSVLDQLYELAGGEDLSGAYKAAQRGEYLPAFGQGAAGAATALGTVIPAFRAGGAVARAASPVAREAVASLPGLLADEAGALRMRAQRPELWQPAAPNVIRAPESPIDYRGINMAEQPDVPQFSLIRPSYAPPRGSRDDPRAKWNALDNPETWDRYREAARIGLPEGRWGGREWYNTIPLLRAFLEINPSGGERDFRRFIDYVGASSPSNPVPNNIRTASYLYHADKQGIDLPPLYPADRGPPSIYPEDVRNLMFPKDAAGNALKSRLSKAELAALQDQFGLPAGYGGKTQGNWIPHAERIRQGIDFDLSRNPKPPSFVQNLLGNYEPFTIDRHNMRVMTGWTPERGFPPGFADAPPPEAYSILERLQQRYARDLGIRPAQTQAATWLGGETGVKSSLVQPFAGEFEQKLYEAAARYGISPKELMRDFVLGNRPL